MSWAALVLTMAMSALVALGVYVPLNTLDVLSLPSVSRASGWLTLLVVGLVGLAFTLVLAIVMLFVARPRLVATVALVVTLVLPVVSALAALKFGADAFVRHASAQLGDAGFSAASSFADKLGDHGTGVAILRSLIHWVLG